MPQVPIFNQPQVETSREGQAYSNLKADKDAFGVSGIEDVGQGLLYASMALQEKQEEMEKAYVTDATNKIAQFELDYLHNPENGYYTKTGKDATKDSGLPKKIIEDYDKLVNETLNSLPSNLSKKTFTDIANKSKPSMLRGIYTHEDNQTKIYHKKIMEDGILTQTKMAVANRNDPLKLSSSFANLSSVYEANSKESDPNLRKSEKEKYISDAHLAVLEAKLADGNLDAKDYFEKNKEQIDPLKQANYLSAIKENNLKGLSQLKSDEIFSLNLSEDEALKKAREIDDPYLRDATEDRILERFSQKRRIEKQKQDEIDEDGWVKIEASPSYNNIPINASPQTKLSMKNYIDSMVKEGSVKTNQRVWYELYNMAIDNPEEFKKTNLMEYKGYLSDSDFQEIAKLKKSAETPQYTQIISPYQEVRNVGKTLGFIESNGKDKDSNLETRFQYTVQTTLQAEEQAKGRKLTDPERSQFIKSFEYTGDHPGKDYDVTWQAYEKGLENNPNFLKETMNDIKYFERIHGRMPDAKERDTIIYGRAGKIQQQKNIDAVNNSKPNKNKYNDLVYREAKKYKISSNLVHSVIKAESSYNPNAKSSAGAGGLMQLMPATARGLGVKDIYNPEDNIRGGVKHLAGLLAKYNGNERSAIAAYNAGGGTVDDYLNGTNKTGRNPKRLKTPDGVPPYKETQNYVAKILGNSPQKPNQQNVRMKAPNGKIYAVPAERVAEYEKAGGTVIQ